MRCLSCESGGGDGQVLNACAKLKYVTQSPLLSELFIRFRRAGCVALCEIEGKNAINILAIRPQREDDYH